ncbi:sulfatase [Marinovum sp. 2_MG-2023]|uniref:sulfatase family protein n=1 Tax=unclassified Marinovum TaxID=2647166 RepID=UPI0026E35FBF|nr:MULTISPECIES: sulfatase [unclassified Marinovum]MDO6732616.1 sulfatase [Marinovum sp. 2_MG-2023]MDO6781915.1 sulfatase [Marinovum sp. 1_MG-2023]
MPNSSSRPNILILYPDQMRYDAMSPSGNTVVRTPNLQRLADEGMTFDAAFTSYPLCCPFRASLMTGKYAQGHGMYQNHFPLRADQEFLAERLKDTGYQTLYVGKWHLEGGPKPGFVPPGRRFGFDRFVGFNRGHNYMDGIFWRDTDQPYRCARYEPHFQTDHMIEFIDEALETPENPFFGFLSYGPPHHPNDMPEHWRKMYRENEIELSPAHLSPEEQRRIQEERVSIDCNGDAKAALKSKCSYGAKQPLEPETPEEQRRFIAEYYGMTSCIDFNVGRLLNHLDRRGIAENTLVIFLSDHGDMLGEHGYFCGFKPQGYRAAMQVPFIARWPGRIAPGTRTDALIDVGPDTPVTLLDIVGGKALSEAHGISYRSVLEGGTGERDAVWYQTFRMEDGAKGEYTPVPERGIRTRDWLYVRQPARRKFLFDQNADPQELTNLVGAGHEALMTEFDDRIAAHMAATGDAWDLHLNFPPPDFLSHGDAKRHLEQDLLPRAILVP